MIGYLKLISEFILTLNVFINVLILLASRLIVGVSCLVAWLMTPRFESHHSRCVKQVRLLNVTGLGSIPMTGTFGKGWVDSNRV